MGPIYILNILSSIWVESIELIGRLNNLNNSEHNLLIALLQDIK